MKILAFTAGAAQMYCGSCIRDNALAAELKRQGHDVILQPIYTPTLTDEENVSDPRVFFGGISIYLEQHSAFFRKSPRVLDRLWDSQWALKLASRSAIPVDARFLGELTVSMLCGESGVLRKEVEKLTDWLAAEPPPDVVTLPFSLLIGLARPIRKAVNRPVCCTLQGEDLYLSQLQDPYRTKAIELIRANVEHVDGFAAVSEYYAEFMCRYLGIPESRMWVVPLGVNCTEEPVGRQGPLPYGRGSVQMAAGTEPRALASGYVVGYLARVAPEKGLHVLAEAYIKLRRETEFTGTLEAAGYLAPEHRGYLRDIEQRIRDAGLAGEFRYHGKLDRAQKIEFLRKLDVMCVPSTYDEPKGISILEAMANGVPVIQPRRGSYPEMIAKTGGGLLVAPDDPASLADGILTLWKDRTLAAELGRRGARGVREHYSTAHMAARALEAYRSITGVAAHA